MNKSEKTVKLSSMVIGIIVSVFTTAFLIIGSYMVYLDIVTSEDRLAVYLENGSSPADKDTARKNDYKVFEIKTDGGNTVVRIETNGDAVISEDAGNTEKR